MPKCGRKDRCVGRGLAAAATRAQYPLISGGVRGWHTSPLVAAASSKPESHPKSDLEASPSVSEGPLPPVCLRPFPGGPQLCHLQRCLYVATASRVAGLSCRSLNGKVARTGRVQTDDTWLRGSRNSRLRPCLLACDSLSWQLSLEIPFQGTEESLGQGHTSLQK